MLFGSYRFHCCFENDAQLPVYKGSTFRGVFGRTLKEITCSSKKSACLNCAVKEKCLYFKIFETDPFKATSTAPHAHNKPHPFVIEPPIETRTSYTAGEPFDFGLLLFGTFTRNLPYFIFAFEKMGRLGIGRAVEGRRGQFRLEKVTSQGQLIYTCMDKFLVDNGVQTELHPASMHRLTDPPHTLLVRLQTPLRMKFKNKYKAQLPFHVLVRACLRRMSALMNHYGNGEPALDYTGLVRRAEKVTADQSKLRWYDWRRYSFRQDQAMLMGGMIGEVVYTDVPGDYLPLLAFAEKTHLGKQTAFGLGKIEIEKITE